MADAKPIDPSTERVANTVAFLLRFSDEYEYLRTNGAETPLTEMLDKLKPEDKEELYKKACETIAEMDEAMKETPSLKERATEFLKTHSFEDIANSALRAATEARQAFNRTKLAAKEAAQGAAEMGSEKINELKEFAKKKMNMSYDDLSEEQKAQVEKAFETAAKAKETISKGFSGLQSFGSNMLNKAKTMTTKQPPQGGKRKNKTKKLTKKEKKMKRARK